KHRLVVRGRVHGKVIGAGSTRCQIGKKKPSKGPVPPTPSPPAPTGPPLQVPNGNLIPTEQNLPLVLAATAELINLERARHGLPPLAQNAQLAAAAAGHAIDMVVRSDFSHYGVNNSTA